VREQGNDAVLIPLSPAASYSLDRRKIPHRSVRSYTGGEDFYRTGLDNFGRMEQLFRVLEPGLKNLHGISTLEPARYSLYNLKILIDVLYTSIALIQRIIHEERPDAICLPVKRVPEERERRYAFSDEESVYATILSLDGWRVPVEFLEQGTTSAPDPHTAVSYPPLREQLRRWISSRDPLLNAGILLKRQNAVSVSKAYFRGLLKRSGGPVLMYGSGYNWDDALVELYREGWRPIHRITDEMAGALFPSPRFKNTVLDILEAHPHLQEFKQFLSIDTWPFLSERISAIVSDSIVASIKSYRDTQDLIAEKGIRVFLISVREGAAGHAAVQAARDAGIPVISWQHGGAGYTFHPMMPYFECVNTDLHLVFGTPVAESYGRDIEWLGWKDRPAIRAVGSSSLDRMRARLSSDRGRRNEGPVLYVTTHYYRNLYYISQYKDPAGYVEHLWEVQKRVIDLAGRFPDREFIIKLHPVDRSGEPLGSYILDSGRTNIRCSTAEETLEDLMPRSSLILFDLVSTGILQALLTEKPVFLYSALSPLDETASSLLQERAVVSGDLDEFIGTVAEYLGGKLKAKDPPPGSLDFVSAYGLHKTDGMSAKRAVSLVGRMAKDSPGPPLKKTEDPEDESGTHR